MPFGLFLVIAVLCTLLAAPWRLTTSSTTVNAPYLLLLAGLIQLPVLLGHLHQGPLIGVLLTGCWCLRNQRLPGVWLLLIGLVGNGLAMAIHGGAMPLALDIAAQLGISDTAGLLPGSKDTIGDGTLWDYLGDWILVRTPWSAVVLSPGDLCIFAALIRWSYVVRQPHHLPEHTRLNLSLDHPVKPAL